MCDGDTIANDVYIYIYISKGKCDGDTIANDVCWNKLYLQSVVSPIHQSSRTCTNSPHRIQELVIDMCTHTHTHIYIYIYICMLLRRTAVGWSITSPN